ncbi:putative transcriptional adapter 2 [Glarea lozoyensis 74030]|nr:putative transcriptional adapter 2 [Glarea lozoyensis 74030]
MMNKNDFEDFTTGLTKELHLRAAISQLQEWRRNGVETMRGGEKYELEKSQRVQNKQPMGSLDRERLASSQRSAKPPPVLETPSGVAALIAPDLAPGLLADTPLPHRTALAEKTNGALTNGHTNGASIKPKYTIPPLSNVTPLNLTKENAPDIHLLTPEECELCRMCRIQPKPYLVLKERILKEAVQGNGALKKKQVKELCRVDGQKAGRIFDFFVNAGWVAKA